MLCVELQESNYVDLLMTSLYNAVIKRNVSINREYLAVNYLQFCSDSGLRIYQNDETGFNGNPANYPQVGSKPKQTKVEQSETNQSCANKHSHENKDPFAVFLQRYKGCQCHCH